MTTRSLQNTIRTLLSLTLFAVLSSAGAEGDSAESISTNTIANDFTFELNDVADRLVIITCKSGGEVWLASGFAASMGGKTYIFTNQDVLLGAAKISFSSADGTTLRPRKVELAETHNMARLELEGGAAFEFTHSAYMDDPVAVFGNDDGCMESFFGKINGLGADLIETSAEFKSANGGAPVLNQEQQVIGIASHIRESRNHSMKEGTKFEDRTRRFCQRFSGVSWKTVNWKRYNDAFGTGYRQNEALIENAFDIIIAWWEKPFMDVSFEGDVNRSVSAWAKSHNSVIHKHAGGSSRRQKYSAYNESLQQFSDVCQKSARQTYMLAERRELTGFLRNEFAAQASALEYATKYIKRRGDTIHTHRED